MCVKCTFLDTDASECVAVVHRNLTNIERSSKFTRSGDIASGCIEGVNLEDYQVGVIGGRLLKSGVYMCYGWHCKFPIPIILLYSVVL